MSNFIKNEYKLASPERKKQLNEATKKWRKNNTEKISIIRKRTDEKRKEKRRISIIEKTYNISYIEYLNLVEKQKNLCAICGQPETLLGKGGITRLLNIDHCHKTNRVRGLLCASCNLALGNLKDDITLFENAIKYLKEWQ